MESPFGSLAGRQSSPGLAGPSATADVRDGCDCDGDVRAGLTSETAPACEGAVLPQRGNAC